MKDEFYDNIYGNDNSTGYMDLLTRLDRLDEELHGMYKKRKKYKKKGKKVKSKKIKKKIKTIEKEINKINYFLGLLALQEQKPQRNQWWQDTINNSLPKALELATATISRLPTKSQSQLYLMDTGGKH